MILMYALIGLAFAIPEIIIVFNCPPLKRFIEKNPIIELVFSLALSYILALVMGTGAGVTIMVANVVSTIITLLFYHWDVMGKMVAFAEFRRTSRTSITNAYHYGVACFRAMKVLLKVLFAPVAGCFWLMKKLSR